MFYDERCNPYVILFPQGSDVMVSFSGCAFRTALPLHPRLGYDVGSIIIIVVLTYSRQLLPLTQQGPASLPSARHHLRSAYAINTHLHRSLGSHVVSTQPVHDRPHLRESKSSVPLWSTVVIRLVSHSAIYENRHSLPWNGGWSAGRTLRPRGNPRP